MSLQASKRVQLGKRVTLTATVISPLGNVGPVTPTGAVSFRAGDRPIPGCGARAIRDSVATCSVVYRSGGRHRISARYAGDSNFSGVGVAVAGDPGGPRRLERTTRVGERDRPVEVRLPPHLHAGDGLRATGVLQGMTLTTDLHGAGLPVRQALDGRAIELCRRGAGRLHDKLIDRPVAVLQPPAAAAGLADHDQDHAPALGGQVLLVRGRRRPAAEHRAVLPGSRLEQARGGVLT